MPSPLGNVLSRTLGGIGKGVARHWKPIALTGGVIAPLGAKTYSTLSDIQSAAKQAPAQMRQTVQQAIDEKAEPLREAGNKANAMATEVKSMWDRYKPAIPWVAGGLATLSAAGLLTYILRRNAQKSDAED